MRVLWAVDHGLQSVSKRMEDRLGVTGPQRLVLRMIGRFPKIAAGELAELLHVHPSTLTGVLKRLEMRDMLVRKPDPGDARRALFVLTARGRAADQTRSGTVEAAVRRGLGLVSDSERATALKVLTVLIGELARDPEPADRQRRKPSKSSKVR
ncbi:MAG: MarR family transcriptional regulator [Deltaproteobacteria bacterium]|nr:MarR family transcriptional regulator [Deltaproteobacteria bacterium]